jgi:hypothetical protein
MKMMMKKKPRRLRLSQARAARRRANEYLIPPN